MCKIRFAEMSHELLAINLFFGWQRDVLRIRIYESERILRMHNMLPGYTSSIRHVLSAYFSSINLKSLLLRLTYLVIGSYLLDQLLQ